MHSLHNLFLTLFNFTHKNTIFKSFYSYVCKKYMEHFNCFLP